MSLEREAEWNTFWLTAHGSQLYALQLRAYTPAMPKLIVESVGTFEVPLGKRLVNALEDEAGVDQLHACGGQGKCTTCRVEFIDHEPAAMTARERETLTAKGLIGQAGTRLSCQITCDTDMSVRAVSRLAGSGRKDAGPRCADGVEPAAG